MDKMDAKAWQDLMDEPTTPEDEAQEIVGVYLDPKTDKLPVLHHKEQLQKNITNIQEGFKHMAQGIAKAS
ncbi:hypothetical protein HON22_04280 [Candidatus Peregrinibacteria bacterium]|jgi:hypothetical protein|nr:hypothetical protein [Candidatus Peregrinibacteria bacterium]